MLRFLAMLALGGAGWTMAIQAQAEVSFKGMTITMVVPFKSGGGTDVWARFWSPLIAAQLPGEPQIEVVNIPGGGSTKGANYFAENATQDGHTVLASSASVLYAYILGDKRVRYDYADWQAVLASPTGGVVYTAPEMLSPGPEPLVHAADVEWKMYIQGPTQLGLLLMLSMEVLGFDYEVQFGASGGGSTFEAFRNGLFNVDMQTTASYLTNVRNLVDNDRAVPMFSFGVVGLGDKIFRDQTFRAVPTLLEVYKRLHNDKAPTSKAYEAWYKFFLAGFPAQKMLILPKDIDPEVLAAFEEAVHKVVSDEDSWPATKHEILGDYRQVTGVAANALLHDAARLDPEIVAWYKGWVNRRFGIEL